MRQPFWRVAGALLAVGLVALAGCFAQQAAPSSPAAGPFEAQARPAETPGKLILSVRWPDRQANLIPTSAESLDFELRQGGSLVTSATIARPESTKTLSLDRGTYSMAVKARPGAGYSGTVIATVTQPITIYSSAITTAMFDLESEFLPSIGAISPAQFDVGTTMTVTGSNFSPGWTGTSQPIISFPGAAPFAPTSFNATSIAFAVPTGAASEGNFTITVDGVTTTYPYSLGTSKLVLSSGTLAPLSANDSAGVTFTAPLGQGGTQVTFSAVGTWQQGSSGNQVNAAGDSAATAGSGAQMPAERSMALVARINSGPWQVIGPQQTLTLGSGDTVTFKANSASFGSNSGSQTISYSARWTSTGTLNVAANSSSGTTFQAPTRADVHCQFDVAGPQTWTFNGSAVGAGGTGGSADGSYPLPGNSIAALIVQRGDSTYEPAGTPRAIAVSSGESLRLRINDTAGHVSGNSGSLTVSYACGDDTFGNANLTVN